MAEFVDHQVFLSYSRNDLAAAKQIQEILQDQGILVWRDQDSIYGGQKWPKAIGEAIAARSLFVLLWSKEAAASHFVEFEWNTALALRKEIIPILLDEQPLPPSLQAFHGIPYASLSGSTYLQTQLEKATQPDRDQQKAVLKKLDRLPGGASEKVVAEAKAIYQQEGWKVSGNVYHISGGNVTIHTPPEQPQEQKKWYGKWEIWLGAGAAILLILIILNATSYNPESSDHQEEFFLTVDIHGPNGVSDVPDVGKARVQIGEYRSPTKEVVNGELSFVNIPKKYLHDTVKLELFSRPYLVQDQSAYTPNENKHITFKVKPEVEYITVGGIVYENGRRIAGAIVEFDSGLAQDTTGADGKFGLTLPKRPGDYSVLSIIYNGQERFRREVMLSSNDLFLTLDP